MPALSDAVKKADLPQIKMLLAKGAPAWEISSALGAATWTEPPNGEIIQLLVGPNPAAAGPGLWNAVANNRLEAVRILLAAGVPAAVAPGELQSPLHTAALKGNVDLVRTLLDGGAPIDHLGWAESASRDNPDGHNALYSAIRGKHVEVVRLLVERGANLNLLSKMQRLPLDMAREIGDASIIGILEQAGARPVTPDMLDLPGAVQVDAQARVRELAPAASAEARKAALLVASMVGMDGVRDGCFKLLLDAGPLPAVDLADLFNDAVTSYRPSIIDLLLASGMDVNAPSSDGTPPLCAAARRGNAGWVERLLAMGARVDAVDREGQTALFQAAKAKTSLPVVELLLKAGANPAAKDLTGRTIAQEALEHENPQAAKLLGGPAPRTARQVLADAKKKVVALARTGHVPVLGDADDAPASTRIGGRPGLGDGEAWPACGRCEKPLQFFVQLNTGKLPAPLKTPAKTARVIQLFYCTACDPLRTPSNGVLLRSVPAASLVRLGEPAEPFPARGVAKWSAKKDYPYRDAQDVDREEREALGPLNVGGWKTGGWPRWVQDPDYPTVDGARLTRLVLQLDLPSPLPFDFGDSGAAYVLCAEDDPTRLGFLWQCL